MPRSKKLLSLLTTAAAVTALGACTGATGARTAPRAPVASNVVLAPAVEPPAETPSPANVDTVTPLAGAAIVDGPLLGANGRPACGNVQSKSDESMKSCGDLAQR